MGWATHLVAKSATEFHNGWEGKGLVAPNISSFSNHLAIVGRLQRRTMPRDAAAIVAQRVKLTKAGFAFTQAHSLLAGLREQVEALIATATMAALGVVTVLFASPVSAILALVGVLNFECNLMIWRFNLRMLSVDNQPIPSSGKECLRGIPRS